MVATFVKFQGAYSQQIARVTEITLTSKYCYTFRYKDLELSLKLNKLELDLQTAKRKLINSLHCTVSSHKNEFIKTVRA